MKAAYSQLTGRRCVARWAVLRLVLLLLCSLGLVNQVVAQELKGIPVVVETPDGGVVTGGGADEELSGLIGLQVTHDVRELAGGELAASTGAVAELCESERVRFGHRSPELGCTQPTTARLSGVGWWAGMRDNADPGASLGRR